VVDRTAFLRLLEKPAVVVELGSFHGGSTTLLESVLVTNVSRN
jgi:hypothetical protein